MAVRLCAGERWTQGEQRKRGGDGRAGVAHQGNLLVGADTQSARTAPTENPGIHWICREYHRSSPGGGVPFGAHRVGRWLDIKCYNTYNLPSDPEDPARRAEDGEALQVCGGGGLLSIARTAALIEHAGAEAFKPFNLTTTQYNVLRILRGAGTDGLCRNEVGERLVTKVPDVTRLLDRMEAAGLIVAYARRPGSPIRGDAHH